ncbi:hypothetical protein SAMN04487895_101636 [Paenibacillus sophorae]|uniref:Single-stranded DNA-binding protein n=1 Tax=Paenibacillus sophorae TaxID=1333845 RepID=A0A1H8GTR4_9BACL|nr:hypothetical protein [Paenibacillus sophorae]QWU14334.1 hypothetical protein KP014_20725 [Paenibacillus sophorae]SEN47179.1 hypothetical protein SAMN04487895_101636 [Paenibacillus sophorae]
MTNEKTLQEAQNVVHIEGIVKEVRIEEDKLPMPDGRELIKGEVDIQVDENSIHTINVFSFKLKKGTTDINSIYKGIKTIQEELKEGDRVRVTQGKVDLNEYIGQDDKLKSYPKINSNFINRVKDNEEFNPQATFSLDMMVANVKEETKDGEETGRAIIKGYIPMYNGSVIPFEVVVANPHAVNYVTNNYEKGLTVSVHGKIVNQTIVTKRLVEVGFGEPQEKIDRKTVREYLVEGGSVPLDEDDKNAFDVELVKKALKYREEVYIQGMRDKKKAKEQRNGGSGNNNNDPFSSANTKKDPFAPDENTFGAGKPIDISDDDLPF